MRTIRGVSPAQKLLVRYLRAYRQIFFYSALFLTGVLAGALLLKTLPMEMLESLSALIGHFTARRSAQDLWTTCLSSFTSSALMLAMLFVCGFCAVSQPVIVLTPLFRGLGFGYQAGFLYASMGLAGVGYVALVLLPHMVLSTLILIFGCGEAFTMSTAYYRAARNEGGGRLINTRAYCGKFAVLLILMMAVSLLDAACSFFFSGLFQA